MLPKVIPVSGQLVFDMHGDGKTVCNLSRNEAWAILEQLVALLEPRDYAPRGSNADE
jgi:hypothetical protein